MNENELSKRVEFEQFLQKSILDNMLELSQNEYLSFTDQQKTVIRANLVSLAKTREKEKELYRKHKQAHSSKKKKD